MKILISHQHSSPIKRVEQNVKKVDHFPPAHRRKDVNGRGVPRVFPRNPKDCDLFHIEMAALIIAYYFALHKPSLCVTTSSELSSLAVTLDGLCHDRFN